MLIYDYTNRTYNYETSNIYFLCDLAEMGQEMGIRFSIVTNWDSDIPYEIRFHNVSADDLKFITDFIG